MNKTLFTPSLLILAMVGLIGMAWTLPAEAQEQAEGQGSHLLGPGLPAVFTFDSGSMSCSVSWGTLGAPGPGPFSDPKMNMENVNFGMVVFSLNITSFKAVNNRVTITGQARSITTANEEIIENSVYEFTAEAFDGGSTARDTFSMTLHKEGLMFDGMTFKPAEGKGLITGDVVIRQ